MALRQLEAASDGVPPSQLMELAAACTFAHETVSAATERFLKEMRRHVYVTPKSYLDLLSTYTTLLANKRQELAGSRQRFVTGVAKLEDTKAMVAGLQTELTALEPVLVAKTQESLVLLQQVAVEQADAALVRHRVEAEEATVKKQAYAVAEVQAEAQRELDVAMPAFDRAIKALDALDRKVRECRLVLWWI